MSQRRLSKAELRKALGVADAGIADFFGISRSAVAQWPEDQPIPELRQLQAERMRPELFGPAAGDASPQRLGAASKDGGGAAQTDGVAAALVSEAA